LSDVTLEIVLNEIVEQACLSTGARGAAIILLTEGEMVCRASCGSTAPEVGDRFDITSGLLGDCVKTQSAQLSDDALAGAAQANREAFQRLDVHSVILMPLVLEAECTGILGLFASQPAAFGDAVQQTMEVLARRTLSHLRRAAAIAEGASETAQFKPIPLEQAPGGAPCSFESVAMALALAVIACALLLAVLIPRHFGPRKTTVDTHPQASTPCCVVGKAAITASASGQEQRSDALDQHSAPPKPSLRKPVPPGGLVVFENGKEIFRMPPNSSPGGLTESTRIPSRSKAEKHSQDWR
jgi:hypothetical protein